jgi:hypothetical protein
VTVPTIYKLEPTGILRFVPVQNATDSRVPTMQCGIHRYKLQQKWIEQSERAAICWMDVEIEHDPSPETMARRRPDREEGTAHE